MVNLTDIISFHQLSDCESYSIVIEMAFNCFQKLLGKCILSFYQKEGSNAVTCFGHTVTCESSGFREAVTHTVAPS